eukprot:s1290_g5.t1
MPAQRPKKLALGKTSPQSAQPGSAEQHSNPLIAKDIDAMADGARRCALAQFHLVEAFHWLRHVSLCPSNWKPLQMYSSNLDDWNTDVLGRGRESLAAGSEAK